jgi:hypothetical protein
LTFIAENGNDFLDGGPGTDSLNGGNGTDTCTTGETLSSCENISSNQPPTANAGPDQTVLVGTTVQLNGTGSSDPEGSALAFSWVITAKPFASTATLSGADTATPSFDIDKPGTYTIQLTVSDGQLSSTDTVTISTSNSMPVAHAGADQSGAVTTVIHLDGSQSSDVDGNPLTYQWSLTSKPVSSTVTLSAPTTVNPTLTLDKPGTYTIQLIVNDGTVNSAPASMTISTTNSPPVANAGSDQSGTVGQTLTLDGNTSSDVGGDSLNYQWSLTSQPAGSTVVLNAPTSATPTLALDKPGTYVVQLIVNDGHLDSEPDTATVTVMVPAGNHPPVANAGSNQAVQIGSTVNLDGAHSTDQDGDSLTYQWSFASTPSESTVTFDDNTSATPYFVPDKEGTYLIRLVVSDGQVQSAPATVTITATVGPPPAQLSKIMTSVLSGSHVTIVGSGGSVTSSTTVTITNTRTGQSITVNGTGGGSFGAALAAQPGDTLSIVVTDAAGNASSAVTTVVSASIPVSVTVTAPAAGAPIQGDRVIVRGTVNGPSNTGVTINGIAASVQGTSFLANNVPLATGSNTLTVTATSL